jgi:toxin ParE1/3/4
LVGSARWFLSLMAIVWTITARRDVNAIWDFIEARNPDAAELVSSEILRSVEGLLQFPKRGKPGRVKETRELVISGLPYVVVYLLADENVVILRVLHGAQDWPK